MTRVRALSLIEVVAALVLVAGVATTLLVAQGRSLAQLQATKGQAMAHDLANELMASWKIDPPPPANLQGRFEGHTRWRWRRDSRPYLSARSLDLLEVTLTIQREDQEGSVETLVTYTWLERPELRSG